MSADRLCERNLLNAEVIEQEITSWEGVGAWQIAHQVGELFKKFDTARPMGIFSLGAFARNMSGDGTPGPKATILSVLGENNPCSETTLFFSFGRGIHSRLLVTNSVTGIGIMIDNRPENLPDLFFSVVDPSGVHVAGQWTPFEKFNTAQILIASIDANFRTHETL